MILLLRSTKPLWSLVFPKPQAQGFVSSRIDIRNHTIKAAFFVGASTSGALYDRGSWRKLRLRGSASHQHMTRSRCLLYSSAKAIDEASSVKGTENESGSDDTVEGPSRKDHWDRMFNALKSYKSIHGDTLVPATFPENPQLGNWVDNQRQVYRIYSENIEKDNCDAKDAVTDERIEKLNSIGFVWNLFDHTWNTRYEELKEYVDQHGNALVPWNYAENEKLGSWVGLQRRNYKARQQEENKSGGDVSRCEVILSEERKNKLDAVGFVWDVYEAQWFERLEELKGYRRMYLNTLVPKYCPMYPLLGRWVDKQRLDYSRYQKRKSMEEKWGGVDVLDKEVEDEIKRLNGLHTGMTEERIRLLEAEDFIWDAFAYSWDLKFEELQNFAALNGHANVRETRKGDANASLARWATNQRKNFIKYQNGQPTSLTEEKIERLNSIGFSWEVAKSKLRTKRHRIKASSNPKSTGLANVADT
ncbi:hypothetical protein ACHAWU_000978 [Discostella pseudostelligera]|uniref:Helicase-associated domain-containing protein n=1 Tax=Discostella pseudostelligera TaxID=259834 RepID=A0ABD3MLK0_9STRA